MDLLFKSVYLLLDWLSEVTGSSYNEVNIIAYYIVAPLIYLHLIDRLIQRNILAPLFAVAAAVFISLTPSFGAFSDQLYQQSVEFLEWFEVIGWNYGTASVIICVFVPLAVFLVLLHLAYPSVMRLQSSGSRPSGQRNSSRSNLR